MQTFQRQNDNTIAWQFMDRATDQAVVNDATVTATLKVTSTGATVTGFSAIAMAYVSGSNGRYVGTVAATVFPSSLTLGEDYTLEITATTVAGNVGFRKLPAQVVERTV